MEIDDDVVHNMSEGQNMILEVEDYNRVIKHEEVAVDNMPLILAGPTVL